MDATSATRTTVAEPVLEKITATIDRIDLNRESGNGNPYTLIVTDTADWVYVWNRAWRRELRQHYGQYYELDTHLYVRDKSGPGGETPRYDLEAVVPQRTPLTKQFLERWKRQNWHELFDAAERCVSAVESPWKR